MDPGVGEGQGHVALGHAAIVDCHTGVLTQVRGGHTGHRQTEVSLNAAWNRFLGLDDDCGGNIEGLGHVFCVQYKSEGI